FREHFVDAEKGAFGCRTQKKGAFGCCTQKRRDGFRGGVVTVGRFGGGWDNGGYVMVDSVGGDVRWWCCNDDVAAKVWVASMVMWGGGDGAVVGDEGR
nr:hypothetical protein [Tanacetum cinerariifolium]